MKSVTELTSRDSQTLLATSTITTKPRMFNAEDIDRVGYFFLRIKNIYGSAMIKRTWPDDESMKMAKREYAPQIVKYTRKQIHKGFERLKAAREQGEHEFINVDAVIGLIKNNNEITGSWGTGAHRMYKPENLIGQGTEEGRQKAGTKALAEMRELFN